MTITLRSTKGVALTYSELDGNFTDLNTRVNAKLNSSSVSTFGLSLINDNTAADARTTLGIDIRKLVNGANELVLNSDGSLTVPSLGVIKLGDSKLSLNENGFGAVYLTSTADDTSALLITDSNVDLYAAQNVNITANTTGPGLSWTFGADGTTSFPNNTILATASSSLTTKTFEGNAYAESFQDKNNWQAYAEDDTSGAHPAWSYIRAALPTTESPNFIIENKKASDGVEYRWTFDHNGNIIFPDQTIQTTAYQGSITTGYALTVGDLNTLLVDFRVVTQDNNGHTYYCGNTDTLTPGNSPTIIQVDSAGAVLWQTTLSWEGTVTAAYAYGSLLTVSFSSPGTPDIAWTVTINTIDGSVNSSTYADQGTDLIVNRDLVSGIVTGQPNYNAVVGYVNSGSFNNALLSVKTSSLASFTIAEDGGLGNVGYFGVTSNPTTGDIYAVGHSETYGSIVSMYTIGSGFQWHKNIDFGVSNLRATSVDYSNGFIYITSNNHGNGNDGYLTKLDATTGDVYWQKGLGFELSGYTEAFGIFDGCVSVDGNGDIITAWNYGSEFSQLFDILIIKFDTTGAVKWQRSIGSAENDFTEVSKSSEFLTADSNHVYLAITAYSNNGHSVGGGLQLALDGSGVGTYGIWSYSIQNWTVYAQDTTSGSLDVTSNLIDSVYTITPSAEQNLTTDTTELTTTINLIGGGITTGDITFAGTTIRGPAGNIDDYKVRIKPSLSYLNTLAVYPTGDNDIHLFEDSALGGGITLGDYGKSNISVWGNGGMSSTVDDIALSTINDGTITLKTSTNNGNYEWVFNKNGSVIFPTLTVNLHNGGSQSGQVLQFGDSSKQAIITGPAPANPGDSAQRLIIQGQNGGTGEGGDVYLWAGDADTNGGDIKIYAGDADNASSGNGGYINIDGGNGYDNGGDVSIQGGYSSNGNGGDVNIQAGNSGNSLPGIVRITSNNNNWLFEPTGKTTFPGAVVKSTVPNTGAVLADIGKGAAATVTPTPSNNTNLNVGTVFGVVFGTGFTLDITVAANGDISAVVTSSNPNLSVGDYGTLLGGGSLGGTVSVDDVTFTVATLTNIIVPTALDLTKSVNKLADGAYSLADGVEGQIMYLVPRTGATNGGINVTIANARILNNSGATTAAIYTDAAYSPFEPSSGGPILNIATLIFTDGAWQASSGTWI